MPALSAMAPPSISPAGWVTLAAAMAPRMVSSEIPADDTAAGSTCTRMAGCSAPVTTTCATPFTRAMRGDSTVSTAS